MRMIAGFVKYIDLFPVPDQIVKDNNILDKKYNALINVPLLVIDWAKEVTDVDAITRPIEQRTKEWIDEQIAQLHE